MLAITASRGSRNEFLAEALKDRMGKGAVATQGTFDFLLDQKVLSPAVDASIRLRPGIYGGVTQMASRVVDGTCDAVALLSDPTDDDIESPEHRALIRTCIHWQAPLLLTLDDLKQWLGRPSEGAGGPPKRRTSSQSYGFGSGGPPEPERNVDFRGIKRPLLVSQQTIALVAHDDRKLDMMKFVKRYEDLLRKFQRIVATGTTGRHIHEMTGLGVVAYQSGPHGGDVQIAAQVLQHTCHWLVFFIDTLTPHPHEPDVRMLQRTSQIPGVHCQAFFSFETASSAAAEQLRQLAIQ